MMPESVQWTDEEMKELAEKPSPALFFYSYAQDPYRWAVDYGYASMARAGLPMLTFEQHNDGVTWDWRGMREAQ